MWERARLCQGHLARTKVLWLTYHMRICYIDEAGCTGRLPSATSNVQPALIIAGLIIDYKNLARATENFLHTKDRFYPAGTNGPTTYLGGILQEVKGSELRKRACTGGRNQRRHTLGFYDRVFDICEDSESKIIGRIWTKGISQPFVGNSVYTSSIQAICTSFQNYLVENDDLGIVIADSRVKNLNSSVAHSIFTQKFKSSGDVYDRIIDLPTFAHSDNHAGLQIIDIIASGILMPVTIEAYCRKHINSVHTRIDFAQIRWRYAQTIRAMQYRHREANGRMRGGLVVSDGLGHRGGAEMFVQAPNPAANEDDVQSQKCPACVRSSMD